MTVRTRLTHAFRPVLSLLSTAIMEVGILFIVGVWTVMWIYLSKTTADAQGLLEGLIIAVYSLTPAIVVIWWRLSVRTRFELPQLTDRIGPHDHTDAADEPTKSQVAQRFETGQ